MQTEVEEGKNSIVNLFCVEFHGRVCEGDV
jgi:hypothetical protein